MYRLRKFRFLGQFETKNNPVGAEAHFGPRADVVIRPYSADVFNIPINRNLKKGFSFSFICAIMKQMMYGGIVYAEDQ